MPIRTYAWPLSCSSTITCWSGPKGLPLLRWIVQYNNKIDVCGGLYPVRLDELERNHFTWVFEPYRAQRMAGRSEGDDGLVKQTIRDVCDRLS